MANGALTLQAPRLSYEPPTSSSAGGQTGTARRALASLQLSPGEQLLVQGLVRPGAPQVRGLPNDAMRWTQPCQVPIPP